MLNKMVINEELARLQTILILYYKTRSKLELCLKLKYRLPVTRQDISGCFPDCSDEFINILTSDYKLIRDKQLFENILAVFNHYEGRGNKSDTLRKWINVKVDEIIGHLNRSHNCTVYDNKNFADFIALYYGKNASRTNGSEQ
ncbi:MAG: hypothetical protein GY765_40735 [bacterium]|nr:hypothetical protein [bacterium]